MSELSFSVTISRLLFGWRVCIDMGTVDGSDCVLEEGVELGIVINFKRDGGHFIGKHDIFLIEAGSDESLQTLMEGTVVL